LLDSDRILDLGLLGLQLLDVLELLLDLAAFFWRGLALVLFGLVPHVLDLVRETDELALGGLKCPFVGRHRRLLSIRLEREVELHVAPALIIFRWRFSGWRRWLLFL
jgi:hypothetical protein